MFGWRCNMPENTRSAVVHIKFVEKVAIATAKGAGSAGDGLANEKPGT